jgi:serine/threonine protein kinase
MLEPVAGFEKEDALFARAVVSFGLCTEDQVRTALAELEQIRTKGRIKTLAQLLVLKGVVSLEGYKTVRRRIESAKQPLPAPDLTSSGRYLTLPAETLVDGPPPTPLPSLKALQAGEKPRRDREIRKALGVGNEPDEFGVGPYTVKGELGAGAVGMVYRAVDGIGDPCALKLLLSQDSEHRLKRLIAEARITMSFDHPNIVKVRDVGVVNDVAYLAMDLVDGTDLARLLSERSLPAGPSRIELFASVCDAVQHAHERGVIHRDLKPANILVTRDGAPMLTDFGVAKDLKAAGKLVSSTDGMIGTPHYIPPEQLAGQGRVNEPCVDIYALGVILFELLTGSVPFEANDIAAIYRKIRDEDPRLPSEVAPGVSPEIEKVCLQALAKDPSERYATAAALAEDARHFLRGERVVAKRPTPVAGLGKRLAGLMDLFRRKPNS